MDNAVSKNLGVSKTSGPKEHKGSSSKRKEATKKSVNPQELTPEYIAQQRELREQRKALKKKARELNGQVSVVDDDFKVHLRELLTLPSIETSEETSKDIFKVKIMTYNALAQTLIRRTLFPSNGKALKWFVRSQGLLNEIKHYDADIMCLQEVDCQKYDTFWKKEFAKLNFDAIFFNAPQRTHGLCIAFKSSKFKLRHTKRFYMDKEKLGSLSNFVQTNNIALIACLSFSDSVMEKYTNLNRNGIIIGTTHLYWHPYGTLERTRQVGVILDQFSDFKHTMNVLSQNDRDWYCFFTGDFNSQCYHSPYLSMTAKPIEYNQVDKSMIAVCNAYQKYKKSSTIGKCEEDTQKIGDGEEEEKEKQVKQEEEDEDEGSANSNGFEYSPVYEDCPVSPTDAEIIENLQNAHNDIPLRGISLYSVGYRHVHPENSGLNNQRNEPLFSNWASTYVGLLDYIFVVSQWDKTSVHSAKVDTVEDLLEEQKVKLIRLLRLPLPDEMGPQPSGQPRLGQYPSDHLCLLAEVELM